MKLKLLYYKVILQSWNFYVTILYYKAGTYMLQCYITMPEFLYYITLMEQYYITIFYNIVQFFFKYLF